MASILDADQDEEWEFEKVAGKAWENYATQFMPLNTTGRITTRPVKIMKDCEK